jgi:hypothetical protein
MSTSVRACFAAALALSLAAAPSFAQKKVKTETIREQETPAANAKAGKQNPAAVERSARRFSPLRAPAISKRSLRS